MEETEAVRRRLRYGAAGMLALALAGCAAPNGGLVSLPPDGGPHRVTEAVAAPVKAPVLLYRKIGTASWYGAYHQGRPTASGAPYDMNRLTAAHRSLPLATTARVTNLANGRTVTVTINDRGPYWHGRIIDLSAKAAQLLGMRRQGVARVKVEVLASDQPTAAPDVAAVQ